MPARTHIAVCAIVLAALAGCASAPDYPGGQPTGSQRIGVGKGASDSRGTNGPARAQALPRPKAQRAAAIATEQIGVPYRYGGDNPSGFDCSGLVHFAYQQVGVQTPRTTSALWTSLAPVSARRLEIGDVLFFDIAGKVSHVGLYLGRGRFVHAPSSGRHVSVASLDDPFYREAFIRGGRLETASR